jgi:L-threonylcarbamoyladenylate synthase
VAGVDEAVAALRAGEAVILPTDTVYGLCAAPDDEAAIERIDRLKDRPEGMPIALLFPDVATLLERVPELSQRARALLPGPFTFVVLHGGGTVGVRVPELHGQTREVLARVGAVAATSANRHGGPEPSRLDAVPAEIRAGCGAEVDGGELPGTPSTVVDLSGPEPRILREGAVSAAETLSRLK